jgi:PAS domain-containing protein
LLQTAARSFSASSPRPTPPIRGQKGGTGLGLALAAYRELEQAVKELNKHSQVLEALQPLPTMMLKMQSGLRGYLLTGSSASLNRCRAAADEFPGVAEKALALLGEDARQRQLVDDSAASARDWLTRHASPLGMFLADDSGACVQSNPAFERITGLSESAVLGNRWQSTLHPDDRERVLAAWSRATGSGAPQDSESGSIAAGGRPNATPSAAPCD